MTDRTHDGNRRLARRELNTNEPDDCVTVTPLYTKLSASDTGPGNAGYQLVRTVSADEKKNSDGCAIDVIGLVPCIITIAGQTTEEQLNRKKKGRNFAARLAANRTQPGRNRRPHKRKVLREKGTSGAQGVQEPAQGKNTCSRGHKTHAHVFARLRRSAMSHSEAARVDRSKKIEKRRKKPDAEPAPYNDALFFGGHEGDEKEIRVRRVNRLRNRRL